MEDKVADDISNKGKRGTILVVSILITVLAFGFIWSLAIEKETDTASSSKVLTLNDSVIVNEFSYTVTSAKRDGEEVTLNVRAVNKSDRPATIYNATVWLIDSEGRLYSEETNGISRADINPGIASEGRILFRVPADVTGLRAAISEDAIASMLERDAQYTYIDIGL